MQEEVFLLSDGAARVTDDLEAEVLPQPVVDDAVHNSLVLVASGRHHGHRGAVSEGGLDVPQLPLQLRQRRRDHSEVSAHWHWHRCTRKHMGARGMKT